MTEHVITFNQNGNIEASGPGTNNEVRVRAGDTVKFVNNSPCKITVQMEDSNVFEASARLIFGKGATGTETVASNAEHRIHEFSYTGSCVNKGGLGGGGSGRIVVND